jgi:hypothetical protein
LEEGGGLSSQYVFDLYEILGLNTKTLQVTNFLNKMAREIDVTIPGVVEHPEKLPGHIAHHDNPNKDPDLAPKPQFHPMQRKLALPLGI